MLILSRKPNESIRIGSDIGVRVLAVQGKKVLLGISAPSDISIWRAELIADGDTLPVRHTSWSNEADLNVTC